MTHSCKAVLNKIIDFSGKKCILLCLRRDGKIAKYGSAPNSSILDVSKYNGELDAIIQRLKDDGFLESPYSGTFRLTHKGLHYKEYQFESIKDFALNSILVPIVVSAITTLLTLWLQALLSTP